MTDETKKPLLPDEFSEDGETCPLCGKKEVIQGYGLAGGGMGPYEMCDAGDCDWFAKGLDKDIE